MVARPGDHLMCPFECDACQFLKLVGRTPDVGSDLDARRLAFIRRANLDAFWAREPSTIAGNLREVLLTISTGRDLQIPMFGPLGPWPLTYDHGMRTAIAVLDRTLQPGRHEATLKFSTARKTRTAFTNYWGASALGTSTAQFWRLDKRRGITSKCPTDSEWYTRFSAGLENRLGQRIRQDAAISIGVMLQLMSLFETDYMNERHDRASRRKVVEAANFVMWSYCANLRGYEVPRVVLTYLREFRQPEWVGTVGPHFGLPMAGRFKLRGNMEQNLLLFVAAETRSGLRPLLWADRLVETLASLQLVSGWAFQRDDGSPQQMSDFEEVIFDKLLQVQTERPDLIDPAIDVCEDFGLARSFRRGATTQAQNQRVSETDINWISRWGREGDSGKSPYFQGNMRIHYSDQRQMAATFLRFSQAL